MKIDEVKLRAMSVHDGHTIWKRARGMTAPEAKQMVAWIEGLGLPYSDSDCLKGDDPIFIKMYELILSSEGKKAAIEATREGLPAMAYVDPILARVLGVDYASHNMGTTSAGSLVAEMMRTQGYKNTGKKGKLPQGCVAKTAELYAPI